MFGTTTQNTSILYGCCKVLDYQKSMLTQKFKTMKLQTFPQNRREQRTNTPELEMLFKVKYRKRTLNKDLHMLLVLLETVRMCEGP